MIVDLIPEYFVLTLQTILYPLTNYLLPLLSAPLRARLQFENKNLIDPTAKSFAEIGIKADHCFEISSEGEFEQIAPLLIDLLQCNLRIELIFCSPSVEKRVESLSRQYSNLRILRMPLLTFSWFGQSVLAWSTAPSIILCRYDFFPELMIAVKKKQGKLISATLIGKKTTPWYLKRYYHFFSELLVATQIDKDRFENELGISTERLCFLELRFIQIERRLSQKTVAMEAKQASGFYSQWLKSTDQQKLIIGSMWPVEIDLFSRSLKEAIKNKRLHVAIFPHHLQGAVYNELVDHLQVILEDIPLIIIDDKISIETLQRSLQTPTVVIFKMKGLLCEYYSLFNVAYVGGGHGRSIHSILEPFLAGPVLFCGPGTHRSTEFLVVKDTVPNEIVVVEKLELFYQTLIQYAGVVNFDKRLSLIKEMNTRYKIYFERFTKGNL